MKVVSDTRLEKKKNPMEVARSSQAVMVVLAKYIATGGPAMPVVMAIMPAANPASIVLRGH